MRRERTREKIKRTKGGEVEANRVEKNRGKRNGNSFILHLN
jgi:hypothetical protein